MHRRNKPSSRRRKRFASALIQPDPDQQCRQGRTDNARQQPSVHGERDTCERRPQGCSDKTRCDKDRGDSSARLRSKSVDDRLMRDLQTHDTDIKNHNSDQQRCERMRSRQNETPCTKRRNRKGPGRGEGVTTVGKPPGAAGSHRAGGASETEQAYLRFRIVIRRTAQKKSEARPEHAERAQPKCGEQRTLAYSTAPLLRG